MILFHPGDSSTWLMDKESETELDSMDWLFQTKKGWDVFAWDEDTGKWDWFHYYGDDKEFKKHFGGSTPATEKQLRKLVNVIFVGEQEEEDD